MSKRIIKIMIVLSTLAMSAVIILSELIQTPSVAMARTTLPGVEKVRTQNTAEDAFTILEIVPDAGMGEIGYYICGAEPWKTEILSYRTKLDREAYLKSLYDPATKEGRLSSIVAETFNAAPLLYQNYEEKYFLTETESSSGSWNYFDYSSDPLVVSLKGQYVLVDGDAISDYTRTVNAEGAETFSYTPGTGSYKWVSSDAETEKSVEVGKVYYKGAFVNQEWFKNYVVDLDSTQYSGFHIKVQTITPEQLENFDVSSADMIYIAGSNKSFLPVGTPDVYYGSDSSDYNDISWSRTVSILENIVHRNLPVIVDYSVISDAVNVTGRNSANMFRLAAILLQNDLASYYRTQIESSTENPIWTDIPEGAFLDEDNHYVNKNIYVFTQGAEEVNGLVSSNFITPFTNDQINGGFSAVLSELQNENSYLKTIGSTEKISEDVTQAAVVKYIINYANRRGAILKSSVRVLEIEPCEAYFLTKDKIRALTKKTSAELEDDQIELVQMTTAEFIGMKEDLNSRYDMIYIGLETGLMNLVKEGGITYTAYNDFQMKGLIYANTGDLVYGSSQLAGLLNSDYDSAGNLLTSPGAYRYSGNDITKEKYLALENYVQSGNPVVLADSFYLTTSIKIDKKTTVTTTTINDTAIDDASWMYRFAYKMYTEEHKSNVLKYGDLSANTTLFASYLNMPKVMIDLEPLKNLDVNGISHVAPSSNGKYYLTFDFTIQNMSAISQKYYDCSLYMDTDSDGRFADSWDMNGDVLQSSEKISGIKITCAGTTVQPREVIDSSGTKVLKYFLGTGIRYHLEAAVPSGCQGVMPWKIEVAQTDNDAARESTTGYSLLETARKEDIRILQIRTEASDSTLGTSAMNLQDELAKSTDQSNFSKYIKELDEFDVSVTTVSGAEYAAYYQSNTGYLNDFDMLILGFADCYSAIDNSSGAVTGIYDFIASGKGVLFTHDTTPLSADSYLSYQKKTALRNITGMDRYGVTVNDLLKTGEKYLFYTGTTEGANYTAVTGTTSHEVAYEPNSNCLATSPQVQGYTYSVLNQKMLSTYDSKTQLANLAGIGTAAADYQTTYISQVNQGLVTTYPYNIDENLQVSATHAPYYQLNLAADDDGDGEGDVVVWYCLGGSPAGTIPASGTAYSKSPNDVRNNYFIYSKGNVVYSGIHLTGSTGVEETKLFINTMIAAYSAGVKDPSVTVLENANAGSIEAENIYVPYDAAFMNTITDTADQMGKLLDDYKSIYFKIEDPNFVKGTKIMSVKYYRKALETETSSKLVGGEPVIELTDLKTYIAGTITEVGVSALSSGTVYEARVNLNSYLAGKNSAKIYVEIQSEIRNTENVVITTLQGHDSVNLVMTQLFDLE